MATMQPFGFNGMVSGTACRGDSAQVRCALTAVMKRMFASGHNFNEGGF